MTIGKSCSLVMLAVLGLCLGACGMARADSLLAINDSNNSLISINPTTFAVTTIGSTGVGTGDFGDLTYDSANGQLYWAAGRGNDNLYTLNQSTGAATLVGTHGIDDLFALAYDSANGKLYAESSVGNVYTIDSTTAAATLIGSNSVYPGGFAYRADTNQLILLSAGGGAFYTVDTTTGAATQLNAGVGFVNDNGITYDPTRNAYWVDDWSDNLYKYDATTFSRTTPLTTTFPMDGIVYMNGAATIPEPSTLVLSSVGAALLGLGYLRSRKHTTA